MYIKRAIENTLLKVSKSFQTIAIYGPRQVGKSTCIRMVFGKEMKYVSLDDRQVYQYAKTSPKEFIESYGWPLIIDEIQKVPELMDEIKIKIDQQRIEWLEKNSKRELMLRRGYSGMYPDLSQRSRNERQSAVRGRQWRRAL